MYPNLDPMTALHLARFHESEVGSAFPRGRRRPLWRRGRRAEAGPGGPRRG